MRLAIWLISATALLTVAYIALDLQTDFQSVSQFAFALLNLLSVIALYVILYRHERSDDASFGAALRKYQHCYSRDIPDAELFGMAVGRLSAIDPGDGALKEDGCPKLLATSMKRSRCHDTIFACPPSSASSRPGIFSPSRPSPTAPPAPAPAHRLRRLSSLRTPHRLSHRRRSSPARPAHCWSR